MKHALPPLDGLKVFESAARFLSFTLAAEELCITKGAVSYQIRRLEQQIGVALFRRATRQVYLTEAGQALFKNTRKWFDELDTTLRQVKENDRYDVSIAATTYVAARWLSPRVAKFLEMRPEVSVRFVHDVHASQFRIEDVDIALIWGNCDVSAGADLAAVLPMALYPVCNRKLHRRIQKGEPVESITLLDENRNQDLWEEWFGQPELTNPRQVIEDANVRVQAAIDGQGLILADEMMQSEIHNRLLYAPYASALHGYGYLLRSAPRGNPSPVAADMLQWLVTSI